MPDQPLPQPRSESKRKNIVICCDGTGNEFGLNNSNVVKLYTTLRVANDQVAYYHPGVGTMGAPTARNHVERQWTRLKGLAFGAGFRDNVFDAYRFLMENYSDNDGDPDRVFIFGFSRGAYTARALTGLLHGYGLLCRGNEGHLPYAWQDFLKQVAEAQETEGKGSDTQHSISTRFAFKETFSHPHFSIHFMGLWDTVSSIGWIYTPLRLLYTAQNPIIRTIRHAVSIDERRCFFRDNLYGEPLAHQDVVQAWFAGVHSDVGGSYPQRESALANIALEWMLDEAKIAGISTVQDREDIVFGRVSPQDCPISGLYFRPDPYWPVHHSLHGPWWVAELLPHRYYNKQLKKQNWRIPLGVHRHIPPDAIIHPSVVDRMQNHPYRPPNLPQSELSPLTTPPLGTKANLQDFYVYKPSASTAGSASPVKTAVTTAAAVAAIGLVGAAFLIKKLF